MGAVYRARDTKLGREVAIKVLLPSVANDPERLARFQREAQVLASLNHPNIAAIHGLEAAASTKALILELVDGPTVAERIAQGALPLDEALPIAQQIAEALEAAHDQGIIHRDLKPANIKVRPDGTVKVLDFGLAKAMEPAGTSSVAAAMSPTITSPAMTQAGVILGTAAYMSPEQARGHAVDTRADLWAYGVVLYEMLTGTRVFQGATVSDTLAAVLKTEPDWNALPPATPAAIRRLLRRCLDKDRKRRLDSAAAARLEVEEALTAPSRVEDGTALRGGAPRSAGARALPWAVAGTLASALIAALLSWAPWRGEEPADRPLMRLDVDLGADVSLPAPSTTGSSIVISPDGTRLVYASGTPSILFTRRLDQPKATALPGTEGAASPFFSPDGQWVGFIAGSKLAKVSVDGGAAVPIGNFAASRGVAWGEDNSIFVSAGSRGLMRVAAGGGEPETVARLESGELGLNYPEVMPGGKAIVLTVDMPGPVERNTIEVLTLSDHRRKVLVRGGASARYVRTSPGSGLLVYAVNAAMFAIRFDSDSFETRGTAVPVLDDVAYQSQVGAAQFAVSRTGTLIYRQTSGGASDNA